ncbi:hypothetical protein M413DRAFT_32707 [Hebeloma cylindrosporum]|uniref:Uncharacterized protein n=1 Tax=Hebeloma cylindrosporum TaxID=76867 RepID=A0A0C3BEI1_HEBCY|nr:hypothetical protein M413DRAFT_32707 [Hebeloma cylindrosporum h7]
MMDDAFDNAEQLFCSAYALSDPTPELLNLIKAHPTGRAIGELLLFYINAVEDNPSRADDSDVPWTLREAFYFIAALLSLFLEGSILTRTAKFLAPPTHT